MEGTQDTMGLTQRVSVRADEALLQGELILPPDARGLVLIPHGSGSRRSPHDGLLAERLREAQLGALLLSLLTPPEEDLDARRAAFRFDSDLLASRLEKVTSWSVEQPALRGLPVG